MWLPERSFISPLTAVGPPPWARRRGRAASWGMSEGASGWELNSKSDTNENITPETWRQLLPRASGGCSGEVLLRATLHFKGEGGGAFEWCTWWLQMSVRVLSEWHLLIIISDGVSQLTLKMSYSCCAARCCTRLWSSQQKKSHFCVFHGLWATNAIKELFKPEGFPSVQHGRSCVTLKNSASRKMYFLRAVRWRIKQNQVIGCWKSKMFLCSEGCASYCRVSGTAWSIGPSVFPAVYSLHKINTPECEEVLPILNKLH